MKKTTILIILITSFQITNAICQPVCSGIYLSASDFMSGKIYYASASRKANRESYFDLLSNSRLYVIEADYAWQKIPRAQIFAIKGCDGEIVRIFEGNNYFLLNSGQTIPVYKIYSNSVGKGSISRIKYCFSKDMVSPIMELTIENLKAAFNDDPIFLNAIDTRFKTDSDLYEYNETAKCFEVEKLFTECKFQTKA